MRNVTITLIALDQVTATKCASARPDGSVTDSFAKNMTRVMPALTTLNVLLVSLEKIDHLDANLK